MGDCAVDAANEGDVDDDNDLGMEDVPRALDRDCTDERRLLDTVVAVPDDDARDGSGGDDGGSEGWERSKERCWLTLEGVVDVRWLLALMPVSADRASLLAVTLWALSCLDVVLILSFSSRFSMPVSFGAVKHITLSSSPSSPSLPPPPLVRADECRFAVISFTSYCSSGLTVS